MGIALAGVEPPIRIVLGEPISSEEFWRLCKQNPDMRLERSSQGELVIMSPTGLEGSGMEGDVFGELRNWALRDGRGKAYGSNTGLTLSDSSVLAPDACWISWERINGLTQSDRKRFARVTPEFVVEVRSESDSLKELREKMTLWRANGVELGWLIDSSRKVVEVYRAEKEPEIQEGQSAIYGEGPVAGFVLELRSIWS